MHIFIYNLRSSIYDRFDRTFLLELGEWNVAQDRIDLKNLFVEIRRKGSTSRVSRELDVSMGNISDWKNGRSVPNAVSLVKLADYFGCSVDYLLGRTENRDMI